MGEVHDEGTPRTHSAANMNAATGPEPPRARPDGDAQGPQRASPAPAPAPAPAGGTTTTSTSNTTTTPDTATASNNPPAKGRDTEMHDVDGPPAAATDELSAPLMTTSTSASSHKERDDAQADGAAPYGTRSRNRPRGERVNYAEDSGDMDFEVHPSVEGPPPATTAAVGAPARDSTTSSPNTSARQSPGPAASKKGDVNPASSAPPPRDAAIPGTSSFAANPNANSNPPAPASKKRKAAAAASHTNGANGHAANGTTSRKSAHAQAQPGPASGRESKVYTFDGCDHRLRHGRLVADDGTSFAVDDYVYMVCEPPGEPYYLGRIMEFRHSDLEDPESPVDSIRINWFYRPRDIMRSSQDTRLLYATMHSDISPITSLRGKPTIRHRDDIEEGVGGEKMALDDYRKQKDHFWFDEVFDRFIHRYYKVVPVRRVVNVPDKVKQALRDRWKFIVVEHNKVKEMTQQGKDCKRCHNFASPDDSVECAVCKNMYHMQCVRPPLLKKPSRGFGWSCAPCSRAQERRLEARHTPLMGDTTEAEEEELPEEEDPDSGAANTTAPSPNSSDAEVDLHPGTQAEIRLAKMWPMRYLGIHCRPEDALLYDDRAIYPRASSRLGPRHQANVTIWHGRPVELVKPAEIRKRFTKNAAHKKDGKFAKEAVAALEADREARAKRPKWVQDEPHGYVARGDDHPNSSKENTARLQFAMPAFGEHSSRGLDDGPAAAVDEATVDEYMRRAKAAAKNKDINECSVDFLDAAVRLFQESGYDMDAALRNVRNLDPKKDLRDPMRVLNGEEKKRFDEGAAKYGSELRNIRLHCKSVKPGDVVRYWYMWKKTKRGREIWGAYGGRKGLAKKIDTDSAGKLLDDIADEGDDSAFSLDKATSKRRGFCCKFCSTKRSRQWRRAPGVTPGSMVTAEGKPAVKEKVDTFYVALCDRCAYFWRRYAIIWEEYEDVAKKIAQGGTKQMRRRIDEEVLQEFRNAAEASVGADAGDAGYGTPSGPEPVKKKQKLGDKDGPPAKQKAAAAAPPKQPTPPPPPVVPAPPRFRDLPCAVCNGHTEAGDPAVAVCQSCKLTVHRNCYGLAEQRAAKWTCDTCTNDRKETVSYDYKCVLCPVEERQWSLVESPKVTHKKKGDREKEKERLEKELVDELERTYKQEQVAKGRPPVPREALKRTAANNWVHLTCAVWTLETKFGDTAALDLVEGIPQIPKAKYEQACKICRKTDGACVACHQCATPFHVGCAQQAGYVLGFDITPVKGSRRDSTNYVTFGHEAGQATAAVWCREHTLKTTVHYPNEVVDEQGTYALQRYVSTFKQADLTLTGTTRKANLLDESAKNLPTAGSVPHGNRRASTVTGAAARGARASNAGLPSAGDGESSPTAPPGDRRCDRCEIDTSPRWFLATDKPAATGVNVHGTSNGVKPDTVRDTPMVNGVSDPASGERFYCQKCHWRKANNQPLPEPRPKRDPEQARTQSPPKLPAAMHDSWGSRQPPTRGSTHAQHNMWSHPPSHSGASPAVPPQQATAQGSPPFQASLYRGGSLTQHPHPHHVTSAPPPPSSAHGIAGFGGFRASHHHAAPPPQPQLNLQQRQQQPGLPNGLHSPSSHRVVSIPQRHSPTAHHAPPPFGASAPAGGAPNRLPSYSAAPNPNAVPPQQQHLHHHHHHHGSPPPPPGQHGRPSTPRDAVPGPALAGQTVAPPPLAREQSAAAAGGGASASPNLRNLLH